MNIIFPIILILISFYFLPSLVLASSYIEKNDQPIHVIADRLEVDNKAKIANFIGTVKVCQDDITITSNILEVYYDYKASDEIIYNSNKNEAKGLIDNGSQIRKLIAIGHVKIIQKDRLGIGQKATYWAGSRKILLEGQATVWRGKNQLSGEHITIFLDDNRSIVHSPSGKRVSVTIIPEQKNNNIMIK